MNWDRVEGNWEQLTGHVGPQWGKFNDDQLDLIAGRREQLVGKIQAAYGISQDELERHITECQGRQKNLVYKQ